MGVKASTTLEKSSNLTREEIDHLCNLFRQVCRTKPEKGCTYDDFVRFCEILHPLLTTFIVQFYFGDNSDIIIKSVKEFASIYNFLVRGSIEDKAKIMAAVLLNVKQPSRSFLRESIVTGASAYRKLDTLPINFNIDEHTLKMRTENYFRGLICSYIKLEYNMDCEEFLSWRYVKASFSPQDVDGLASALSEISPLPVTTENLEKWVRNWRTIKLLHYVVYNHLFGLESMQRGATRSLYPLCLVKNIKHTICVMDMCSILHVNSYMPPKHRHRWKLLFSSSLHGVNYQHLVRRILFEGPTVVIIQDKNNYVFGGFASESWRPCRRFYGNCSSFLFQCKPKVQVFEASGQDDGYQFIQVKSKPRGFGMGKGTMGDFAWWIEPERLRGACGDSCRTFEGVTLLASSQYFKIKEFEIWAVEDSRSRQRRERILRYHTLAIVKRDHETNRALAGNAVLGYSGATKYKDGYSVARMDEKQKILEGDDESMYDYDIEQTTRDENENEDEEGEGDDEDDDYDSDLEDDDVSKDKIY